MVVKEILENGFYHYSDNGLMIRKVGTDEIYEEAYDVIDYDYEETDIAIITVDKQLI